MTHLRQRTVVSLIAGWLVAVSSSVALAHPTSANEFNSTGSCAALGIAVGEGVWQWCAKNERKTFDRCRDSFRSWVREVERKCLERRRERGCSPSDYDAALWHLHGWKRPGQQIKLDFAVRFCEEGTQDQAAGPGAGGAPPELDRETRRRVQSALAAQGFDPGQPDGKFGPRTRAAIQAWQQANGHAETGELTSKQVERLLAAESPRFLGAEEGSSDYEATLSALLEREKELLAGVVGQEEQELTLDERRRIQACLQEREFDPGAADGNFGPRTRTAIRAWQAARGREESGRLDQSSARTLLEECEVAVAEADKITRTETETHNKSNSPEPKCGDRSVRGECWYEVKSSYDHSKCYVFAFPLSLPDDDVGNVSRFGDPTIIVEGRENERFGSVLFVPQDVDVTWLGRCVDGKISGKGKITGHGRNGVVEITKFFSEGRDDVRGTTKYKRHLKVKEDDGTREEVLEGTRVDGVRHGKWTERDSHPLFEGEIYRSTEKGMYVEGSREGEWIQKEFFGKKKVHIHTGPYIDGEEHGIWTRRVDYFDSDLYCIVKFRMVYGESAGRISIEPNNVEVCI